MKYTKGKWFWIGDNLRTRQQDDKSWQGTLVFHHNKSKEETKANRDLIAAAPEMLTALKLAKKQIDNPFTADDLEHLSFVLGETIAKAEGSE